MKVAGIEVKDEEECDDEDGARIMDKKEEDEDTKVERDTSPLLSQVGDQEQPNREDSSDAPMGSMGDANPSNTDSDDRSERNLKSAEDQGRFRAKVDSGSESD